MVLRFTSLPLGLRLSLLPPRPIVFSTVRHTSRWAKDPHLFSYFTPSPLRRFALKRTALWLVPVAGGLTLYFAPQPQNLLQSIFSSPKIIPCPDESVSPQSNVHHIIPSPAEPDQTLLARISRFLRDCILEPIQTGQRFIYLVFIFLPVMISAPMLLVGKPEPGLNGDRWGAVWWYDYLVLQMTRAGPTFVKLSQWAASRADLFPTALCERMGRLHSRGKPHSFGHTKRVIERVFQRPFDEVFEEFDHDPIGCGAIAQVYKATLKKDLIPPSQLPPRRSHTPLPVSLTPMLQEPTAVPTATVAIKVLHPRVDKLISRDLSIMSFFAHIISVFPGMQWISLPEEVDVFGHMMYDQLDLRHEAENLERFEKNFRDRNEPIAFPRPLMVWSTRDVLVEEYQNALPLESFLKNGGGPFDHLLAELGLDAFLNMLLLDNFVHSDLHPGNIMIKFSKPPLQHLKEDFFNYINIFKKYDPDPAPTISSAYDPSHLSDSDLIVNRLRDTFHEPDTWRQELFSLETEGYIPELVFIDAGLVTQLDSQNRRNFLDLFRAVAEFDGYRTGQLMVERCRTPDLAIDTETFALKMQHIVLNVKRKTFSLGSIKISDILTDVLKAVRQHHVKMEGDFINTVISILLLEGIGRQLDPGLDLFKSALPILRQLGRQMAVQESMKDVKELPRSNLGAFLKLWVWMEAREMVTAAILDADELVRYDWLTPGI
ncbi:hypothetical protein JAAARDRAFT_29306 [Jaapia argillacea MUCL 33604]|uniref:ABC1 atypical kinase-like domain-containing protein n=1 Tax=Jaapia argillacea MUCL 33604 TaxID=933084 RepID=A0A067Q8B5_9AGAM|nr:hypothetical protein JAAARDRAFT_29306 [Jaapia argillacea MUCL 33604]